VRTGVGSEKTWIAKTAPASARGLCNRCAPESVAAFLRKFESVARNEPAAVFVGTVVDSLSRSQRYLPMFVKILKHVSEVNAGVREEVRLAADAFWSSLPHVIDAYDDDDYDAFCGAIKEKQRRVNATLAFLMLGGACPAVDRCVEAAVESLVPAAGGWDEHAVDLVIEFLDAAMPFLEERVVAKVWKAVSSALEQSPPARLRFMLMDLSSQAEKRRHVAPRDPVLRL
jgi:hypothetical protein